MINIQNIEGNEFFKWSLAKYLNPAEGNRVRITKAGKEFTKKLDIKDIKFPVKVRDIHKIEKINYVGISVLGYGNTSSLCIKKKKKKKKKNFEEKHADLL